MVRPFKDKELNRIAAFFHMGTFLLTSAALVQPSWFRIKGVQCTPQLLTQFFTFEDNDVDYETHQIKIGTYESVYSSLTITNVEEKPPCLTPVIINLMRILILLCFMVLFCSFVGILVNLTSVESRAIKLLRRNAIPSIVCVFWVIMIVGVCYYITVLLENLAELSPSPTIEVDYEYGFYTITAAGALALLASAANLWSSPIPLEDDGQRRSLVGERWEGYEPAPLPPYSLRPTEFAPRRSGNGPAELTTLEPYFPYDELSVLPPPPPYTP